jgi:hypothetical protein
MKQQYTAQDDIRDRQDRLILYCETCRNNVPTIPANEVSFYIDQGYVIATPNWVPLDGVTDADARVFCTHSYWQGALVSLACPASLKLV